MINWLKNLLNLNGFSKGGFTGRGHVSADSLEFILTTESWPTTWAGKESGKPPPKVGCWPLSKGAALCAKCGSEIQRK